MTQDQRLTLRLNQAMAKLLLAREHRMAAERFVREAEHELRAAIDAATTQREADAA